MSYPQRPDQGLLLDTLEALLVESCLTLKESQKPNTVTLVAARSTLAWLVRQNPALASTARLLETLLDAVTGDDAGLSEKLAQLSPQERAFIQKQLVETVFSSAQGSALPPPRMLAALIENGVVRWHSFLRRVLAKSDPSSDLEAMIEALGELSPDALLTAMRNRALTSADMLLVKSWHVINALAKVAHRLDPQKLALIRCLFAVNGVEGCISASDLALALRACDSATTVESRHFALSTIGKRSAGMFYTGITQARLDLDGLDHDLALRLLQVAIPFMDRAARAFDTEFYAAFKGAPPSILDDLELSLRLWKNDLSNAELEALAARQDPIGAMAAARLINAFPARAGEYKLRYPYYLVSDFAQAITFQPMQLFKALTEEISLAAVEGAKSALAILEERSWRRLMEERWDDLIPAQRGVLLGLLLRQSGRMSPTQVRKVVDKCLYGLEAPDIEVVARYSMAMLSIPNYRALNMYQVAYDRFIDLANARGSDARLPTLSSEIPYEATPTEVIAYCIEQNESPALYSDRQRSALTSAVDHMNTPEGARQIAQMLMRHYPSPSKIRHRLIEAICSRLTGESMRAFLDALSPNWQIAVAIATGGLALEKAGKRYLREFIARFPPREQALLLTLKPVYDALGKPPSGRLMNRAEFHVAALAFVSSVPNKIVYATPSPEVRAFVSNLANIATPIPEYAAALQHGHYPIADAISRPLARVTARRASLGSKNNLTP